MNILNFTQAIISLLIIKDMGDQLQEIRTSSPPQPEDFWVHYIVVDLFIKSPEMQQKPFRDQFRLTLQHHNNYIGSLYPNIVSNNIMVSEISNDPGTWLFEITYIIKN